MQGMQGILKGVRDIAAAGAAAAGNALEVDPDPDKILLAYVAHGTAPLWVDPRLGTDCHHCKERFKKGHQHYCRLCGNQFCSMCTGKYHVPEEFKKKGKEGAVRVCFDCRDATLERRERVDPLRKPIRPRLKSRRVNGMLHIYPPEWAQQFDYTDCVQCRQPYGKHPYHCRVCGEMFCSSCTVKTDVPSTFRKKVSKTGPVRCCFECRHKIRGGAFLERDVTRIPQEMMADDRMGGGGGYAKKGGSGGRPTNGYGSVGSSGGGSFLSVGGAGHRAHGGGGGGGGGSRDTPISYSDDTDYDPLQTVIPAKAKPRAKTDFVILDVLKKGKVGAPMTAVTTLELGKNSTLVDVHRELLGMFPSLKQREFHYLCRDAPVLDVHWDIFDIKHFREIVISKGPPVYGAQSSNAATATTSPAAPVTANGDTATADKTVSSTGSVTAKSTTSSSSSSSSSSRTQPRDHALEHHEPNNNVEASVAASVAAHRQSANASPNPAGRSRPNVIGDGIGIKMPGATQINKMAKGMGFKAQVDYYSAQSSSPGQQPMQARKAKLVGVPTTEPGEQEAPLPPVVRSATSTPVPAARQSSSPRRRKMKLPTPDAIWVRCKYTYTAQTETNISFNKHDVLVVIKHESDSQWWFGEHIRNDIDEGIRVRGWFPSSYVRECDAPDDPNDTDSDTDDDEYTHRSNRPPVKTPTPRAEARRSVSSQFAAEEQSSSRFSDHEQSSPYHSPAASPYQAPASPQQQSYGDDMSITQAAFRSSDAPSPMSLNQKSPVLQQPKPQKQRPTSPLLTGAPRGSSGMPAPIGGLAGQRSSSARPSSGIGGPRGAPSFRMPSRESSPALPHSSPNSGVPQRSSSAMRGGRMAKLTSPPMDRSSSAMGRLASGTNGSSSGAGYRRKNSSGLPPVPRQENVPASHSMYVEDDEDDMPPPPMQSNAQSAYPSRRAVDPFATPGASRSATPVQQLQHPDVHHESASRGSGLPPPSPAASPSPFLNAPGMDDAMPAPHVAVPSGPFSDDEDDDDERSPTTFTDRPAGGYLNRKGKINPVRKKRTAGRRVTLLESSRGLFDD